MLKFLYFGDMHGGSKAPQYRTDDFLVTRANKIKEILHIAKEHNVNALLQAGDFLNKANVAPEYLTKEILNWTSVNLNDLVFDIMVGDKTTKDLELALKEVTPMIGTVGNHELVGGELDSFERTSLNMLVQSGFMTLTTKENPIIFKDDEEDFTVAISASPYTHDIDKDDKSAYIIDEKRGDFQIHMVHGMLMDKSYGKKFAHTVVQEIAYDTKADLTINGHDHIGYDEIELDGKKFINPGSPVRLSAEKKEIARMPKVLLITIDKANGVQLEEIYLTAEAGKDVLSREHIEAKEAKSEHIEEIKSLMNKASLKKGIDITEIISNLGETKGIEADIIQEVVDSIVESMDKLMTPFNPKGEYIIERLELVNFQSHKDSVFEFTKGLNVLAGESRNGKSSVLRAIREVFECYMKNPRDAIFFGEDFFRITMYLSNGYIISRVVERKKSGKNGYEIFDPTTGTSSYYNTKALEMVQEILGLNKIKLTERNKVNVNFSVQGDSWFMIGNNMSAPDRAKLIGVMYGTHYADAVLKDLNSQAKKIVTEINVYAKDIANLQEQADEYLYLEPLNECLDEAEVLYQEAFELEELINKATKLLSERANIDKEINELNELIKAIEKNEKEYNQLLQEIKADTEEIALIQKGLADINAIVKDGKQARYVVNNLSSLNDANNLLTEINKLEKEIAVDSEVLEKAKKLETKITSITGELESINNIYNSLKEIEEVNSLINEIKVLDKEITGTNEKVIKAKSIITEQSNIEKEIDLSKSILEDLNSLSNATTLLAEIKDLAEDTNNSIKLVKEAKELEKEIKETQQEEKKHNDQTLVYLKEYKAELETMGECPVCHGKIDKAVINSLVSDLSKNLD